MPATPDEPIANLKQLARSIFTQALADCGIDQAFDRMLGTSTDATGMRLVLDGNDILALDRLKRIRIVAAGKAGSAMLTSLLSRLPVPGSCDMQGILIAAARPQSLPATIQFFPGGHPVPNHASFTGASAALSMLRALENTPEDDNLCIFLLSGGASAMMELPLDPAISLEDTIAFHQALVRCGATIVEINCVRKHFSAVKGGRLALAAGRAHKISLLVSDVPPTHLDALASGPTIADPTTVNQCHDILARYDLLQRFPLSVRRFFESPLLPETPKPDQLTSPVWKLLDSDELARAAQSRAVALGFFTVVDNTCDDWSYSEAARFLLDRLRQLRRHHPKVCLISTGEVTVQVPDTDTRSSKSFVSVNMQSEPTGGRNQHFALYAATLLTRDDDDDAIAILSAGSDGIDGNSDAAGAVVDQRTLMENALYAQAANCGGTLQQSRRTTAQQALAAFDSHSWLHAAGATIITGPTGNNLRDLRILIATDRSAR